MKRCTRCGEMLPLEAFSAKDKRGRLHARCKECLRVVAREAARKRRASPEGKEAVNRYRREWYARNGSKRQASVVARDRSVKELIERHRNEFDAIYRHHAEVLGVEVGRPGRKPESHPSDPQAIVVKVRT